MVFIAVLLLNNAVHLFGILRFQFNGILRICFDNKIKQRLIKLSVALFFCSIRFSFSSSFLLPAARCRKQKLHAGSY